MMTPNYVEDLRRMGKDCFVESLYLIWGGNFYHTFLESPHPALLEKSGWTCQSGSLIGENALPWQPGVKCW